MLRVFERSMCVRMVKAVVISALGLLWQAPLMTACSCLPGQKYCDITTSTSILVSGTILDRTVVEKGPDFTGDDEYMYSINVVRFYKIPEGKAFAQVLQFESPVMSSLCGLYLEIGVEYVVGLSMGSDDELSANSCGPTRELASLTDEQLDVLDNRGKCNDPCDEVVCTPYEVCVKDKNGNPSCECARGDDDDCFFSYAYTTRGKQDDDWF